MAEAGATVRGREAYQRRQWGEAYAQLAAADGVSRLDTGDLGRCAAAAYLVGRDAEAKTLWMRLHHQLVDEGHLEEAARCGFWLSLNLLLAGEVAQATGWLARSQRLLKGREGPCVAQGHGLIVSGLMAMVKGETDGACASFEQAIALAERFGDRDLLALGLLGQGQSLIALRRIAEGVGLLDEAMLAITDEQASPVLAGIVYCAVILVCQSIFDLGRAREWTRQLDEWCAAQSDLVPYRGQCLVHRSEVRQLQGDWDGALAEATQARLHLADRSEAVVGRACYRQGELHRLRGQFEQAEQMYREAARHGVEPQPGLALLRLAQGDPGAAAAAIRSLSGFADGAPKSDVGVSRLGLLGPLVDVLLAAGDLDGARAAADTLAGGAAEIGTPFLLATSKQATGAVLLTGGEADGALGPLRDSWTLWQQLEAPYETGRVRVLIGRACQALQDMETARMHFGAAESIFRRLGAAPDLAQLERLTADTPGSTGKLTGREHQVLLLVAAGKSNRQIAAALAISEHTVARHLSNIFDKLGVGSRTAASAFAHEHKLV